MSLKLKFLKVIFRITKPKLVFYGHNVTEHSGTQVIPSLHLRPEEFESTIKSFQDLGFDFLDLSKLLEISANKFNHSNPWLHMTFDDGYLDNLKVIVPIIKKYNIPVTIFISSNHIETHKRFYTYRIKLAIKYTSSDFDLLGVSMKGSSIDSVRNSTYQQLVIKFIDLGCSEALDFMDQIENLLDQDRWSELNEMYPSDEILTTQELRTLNKEDLVTIGSHNHDHVIMNKNTTKTEVEYQMTESKKWLSDNLGENVLSYCYPNGTANDFTVNSKEVCAKHYKIGFTTIHGFIDEMTDVYEIPRVFLLPDCISIIHRLAFPEFLFKIKSKLT